MKEKYNLPWKQKEEPIEDEDHEERI